MPVAWWAGVLTLAQLLVVVLFVGVATVFFDIAYQSYLPSLVGREHLLEGNAKLQAVQSAAQIAGPSAAGVLVQLVSAAGTVLVTGLGFLTSALCLLRIRAAEPEPQRGACPAAPADRRGAAVRLPDKPLCARSPAARHGELLRRRVHGRAGAVPDADGRVCRRPRSACCWRPAARAASSARSARARSTRRLGQARAIWLVPLVTIPATLLMPLAAPGWRVGLAGLGAASPAATASSSTTSRR